MVATFLKFYLISVISEILMNVNVKIAVFWDVNIGIYVSLHGVIPQNIIIMYVLLTTA
jgi:hypothetical protein